MQHANDSKIIAGNKRVTMKGASRECASLTKIAGSKAYIKSVLKKIAYTSTCITIRVNTEP